MVELVGTQGIFKALKVHVLALIAKYCYRDALSDANIEIHLKSDFQK